MKELYSELRELKENEKRVVYASKSGTEISTIRTDKICPHDFAVEFKIPGEKEFRPTHIRLLFDLYLKRISNPEDAKKLFLILEKVYDGEDPEKLSEEALKLSFPMKIDDPDVNIYCIQLLMIEQEFNYGPDGCKEGKVNPPREFLMRFIRWVASGEEQIDKIIFNAVRNYPPPVRYKERIS